ncbi:MAG: hypothetical protein QM765_11185 [Myxococcales bacterium]
MSVQPELFQNLVVGWIAIAAATFVLLFFISAPYGRHTRKGWGPLIPARLAWVLMECASPLVLAGFFLFGPKGLAAPAAATVVLLALWETHYVHRAFIYPFRLANPRPVPVSVTLMGATFNFVNAGINGYWLFSLADYPSSWLSDPRFIVGTACFVVGFVVNRWSDAILRALRKPGESGYKIPAADPGSWSPAPTTWARSWSGPASRWPAGRSPAWPSPPGPSPTSRRARAPTTSGTARSSRTTPRTAGPCSRSSGDRAAAGLPPSYSRRMASLTACPLPGLEKSATARPMFWASLGRSARSMLSGVFFR